jgi:hypothetical protein
MVRMAICVLTAFTFLGSVAWHVPLTPQSLAGQVRHTSCRKGRSTLSLSQSQYHVLGHHQLSQGPLHSLSHLHEQQVLRPLARHRRLELQHVRHAPLVEFEEWRARVAPAKRRTPPQSAGRAASAYRIVTCGVSGGRSLMRSLRGARRFPSTRWYPVPGLRVRRWDMEVCPSFKGHFLSPRAKPWRYDSQRLHRCTATMWHPIPQLSRSCVAPHGFGVPGWACGHARQPSHLSLLARGGTRLLCSRVWKTAASS